MKLDLDVRRVWQCPKCGRRIKRLGDVVTYQCHCQEPALWMHLMEPARRVRDYQPYIVPEIQADELLGADEPPATEEAVLNEAEALTETAPPPEVEEATAEEEFYSPEEESPVEIPATLEPEITELSEPAAVEPPPPAVESAESATNPPQQSNEPRPHPGKSKRRRGRKRNRGGKPSGEGG